MRLGEVLVLADEDDGLDPELLAGVGLEPLADHLGLADVGEGRVGCGVAPGEDVDAGLLKLGAGQQIGHLGAGGDDGLAGPVGDLGGAQALRVPLGRKSLMVAVVMRVSQDTGQGQALQVSHAMRLSTATVIATHLQCTAHPWRGKRLDEQHSGLALPHTTVELRGHFTKSLAWLLSSGVGLGLGTGLVLVSDLFHRCWMGSVVLAGLVCAVVTGQAISRLRAMRRETEAVLVSAA